MIHCIRPLYKNVNMAHFENGEKVLCFYGRHLYEAKCLKSIITEDDTRYLIHYLGWNSRYDEWVTESRIFKYNEINIQKQRELFREFDEQLVQAKRKTNETDENIIKKTKYVNDTNDDDLACTKCKKSFCSQSDIDKHWQWHILQLEHMQSCCVQLDQVEIFKCDFCTSCFSDATKLRRHKEKCYKNIENLDITEKKQEYSSCNKSPLLSEHDGYMHKLLLDHMFSCCVKLDQVQIFKCDFCTSCFSDVAKLRRHKEECFKNKKRLDITETKKKYISCIEIRSMKLDLDKDLYRNTLQLEHKTDITLDEMEKDENRNNEINKKDVSKNNNMVENVCDDIAVKEVDNMDESEFITMNDIKVIDTELIEINKLKEKVNYMIDENKINEKASNKISNIDKKATLVVGDNKTDENATSKINPNESKMANNPTSNETCQKDKTYQMNIDGKNNIIENGMTSINDNVFDNIYHRELDKNETTKIDKKESKNINESENCNMDEDQSSKINRNYKQKQENNNMDEDEASKMYQNNIDENHTKKIDQNDMEEKDTTNIDENEYNKIDKNETTNEIDQNDMEENVINNMNKNNTNNTLFDLNDMEEKETRIMDENETIKIDQYDMKEKVTNNVDNKDTYKIDQNDIEEKQTDNKDENETNKIEQNDVDEKVKDNMDENSINERDETILNHINQNKKYMVETQLRQDNIKTNIENKTNRSFQNKKREHSYVSRVEKVKPDTSKHSKMYKLLLEHMQSCRVELIQVKVLKCEFCSSCFPDVEKLRTHQKKYFQTGDLIARDKYDIEKPFECDICGWRFMNRTTLKDHSVLHEPFPNMCECGVGYYKKCDLDAHRKLVHPNYEPPTHKPTSKPPAFKIKREIKRETSPDIQLKPHNKQGPRLKATLRFKQPKTKKKNIIRIKIQKPKPKRLKSTIKIDLETDENGNYACTLCAETFITIDNLMIHLYTGHVEKAAGGWSCKICGKTKSHASNLRNHMIAHAGLKPYLCVICDKRFTQTGAVLLHQKRHLGDKQFPCEVCNKSFYNHADLRLHSRVHTGEKPYECKQCGKCFSDPSAFNRHCIIHTGLKPHKCDICPKAFCDPAALFRHKRVHDGYNVQCIACDRTFSSKESMLKHHRLIHTKLKENDKLICDHCGFTCNFKSYLAIHMINVHLRPPTEVECEICCKKYASLWSLKSHLKRVHLNIKRHECDLCGWRFYHNSTMIIHKKQVHRSKNMEKAYECDHCHKSFYRKYYLYNHILINHLGFVCQICKLAFSTSLTLKKHMAVGCKRCRVCDKAFRHPAHLDEHFIAKHLHTNKQQKYECDYCAKQFPVKSYLKNHIKIHMRTKDAFRCDHCDKTFSARESITRHIWDTHMVSLYCNICLKRFSRECDFIKHKREANCRPKKVACEICNKTFSSRYAKLQHMLLHEPRKMECDMCGDRFTLKGTLLRHIRLVHDPDSRAVARRGRLNIERKKQKKLLEDKLELTSDPQSFQLEMDVLNDEVNLMIE